MTPTPGERDASGRFGALWTASTLSSLGDGVTGIAGPLLVASLTRDPVQVAGLLVAERLAWMIFALPSGALVDRMDRRRAMTAASVLRVVVLVLLGAAILLGRAPLPMLYAAFFLVGCAGLLYENAATAILPAVVGPGRLVWANGRLLAARTVGQEFIAAPLGGLLFATAAWSPFAFDAGALVLVVLLTLTLRRDRPRPTAATTVRASIAQGVRWLWHHRILRTLSITVAVSNVGLGAVQAVLVLIAIQRLGLGAVGYGLLLTTVAIGGVVGSLLTARIVRWIGPGNALRAGMVVEAGTHLGLALTRDAVTAGAVLALLGLHLLVFSTINASLRQSLVPAELLGRVHSAYRLSSNAGMLAGALLGGVLARFLGLSAPFWLGFALVVSVTACVWRALGNADVEAARTAVHPPSTVSG
jgi:MFS family permease